MISLKMGSGQPVGLRVFESATFSHPVQSGTGYVEYIFNHNLGVQPFLTRMFAKFSGKWIEQYDWSYGTTRYSYYNTNTAGDPKNQNTVRVQRIDSSARDIKFRFYSDTEV